MSKAVQTQAGPARRWRLPLAVALAVVGGLGALWATRSPSAPPEFGFRIPRGQRLIYALEWRSADSVALAGGAQGVEGTLDLAGKLVLSGLGVQSSAQSRVDVQLAELSRHQLQVMGSEVFPDGPTAEADLTGPRAVMILEPTGRVVSVSFQNEAPPVFKHLINGLLTETQVILPAAPWTPTPEETWEQLTPVLQGEAQLRYRVAAPPTKDALQLVRARTGFKSLRSLEPQVDLSRQVHLVSSGAITLSGAGHLASLEETHALTVDAPTPGARPLLRSQSQLRLDLVRVEDFDPTELERRPAPTHTLKPGELAVTTQTDRQLLEQRAEGTNLRTVLTDLLTFGAAGRMPDHNRWLWRVTGLLQLHPELCAQLLPAFRDPAVGPKGRALILDLLATAGHPLGQDALRQAIRHAQQSVPTSEQVMLLQRLSLVAEPDAQTLEFIARTHAAAVTARDRDTELASLYTLGAALGRGGDPQQRRELNQVLVSALEEAQDSIQRDAALRALGNAGQAENLPRVLAQTAATEPTTRRAAAAALRSPQTRETTDALVGLLRDPQPAVQIEALTSLDEHRLTPSDLEALATVVLSGATAREADADLVNFLAQHLHTSPAVPRALEFIANRGPGQQLEARIRSLLAEARSVQAAMP